MKATKKLLSVLLTLTMVLTFFCGVTAHAEGAGIKLEPVREGDTLKLNIVATEELNFGGLELNNYPTCDVEGVFTNPEAKSGALDATDPGATATNPHPFFQTGNGVTAAAGTVLGYIQYTIDTAAFEEGKEYTFSVGIVDVYNEELESYSWANETLTATFKEGEAPVDPPTPAEGTEIDLSSIKITKVINGEGYDPTTFTFTVTPVGDAPAIDGTFTISTDANPLEVALTKATFEKAGTYTYTVKETAGTEDGWTYDETEYTLEILIEQQNPDGELGMTSFQVSKAGDTAKGTSITFTNNFEVTVADLTIMNINTDNVAAGTEFTYTIVFDADFTDGQTTYTANVASDPFTLGDDESTVIHNIPVGTTFTLTEAAGGTMYKHTMTKGEIISEENGPVTGDDLVMKGTIVKETAEANPNIRAAAEPANYVEIENDLVYEVGTLKITKEVEGEIDPAYTDKEFSFTVTFTVPEEFANIKIKDKDDAEVTGPVTFTLKAGESYESFTNIPVGTTYVLTEAAAEYFTPSYSASSGASGNGEYNTELTTSAITIEKDENTITVTNEYSVTPPTGVTIHSEMILILALVLIAMVGSVVLTKKLRRA